MKPLAFHVRAWQFWLAPFVDRYVGVSITRLIALYFAYLVGLSIRLSHGTVGANALWLGLASIAAAFGKSTFTFLLQRMELKSTSVQTDARSESISTVITERRDPSAG